MYYPYTFRPKKKKEKKEKERMLLASTGSV
jgi:hypothetical protein